MHLFQSYARSKSLHKIAFDFLKFSEANEQQRIKHSQRCDRDLVDTRYADIMSSRSGLCPREAVHRLASPQTSFGVRSSRIHFYPTDGFSYERVAQFNLEWIFIKLDSGFQSLVGFRILSAGFRIPKPRIPDSTSKKFLDSGIRIPLHGTNHNTSTILSTQRRINRIIPTSHLKMGTLLESMKVALLSNKAFILVFEA